MWRKLTELNHHRWTEILQDIVVEYNNDYHGSLILRMTPYQASREENDQIVSKIWAYQLSKHDSEISMNQKKFSVGDKVRVARTKSTFEKGYDRNWSAAIYTITNILDTVPITYKLKDSNDEEMAGSYYNEDLQKTELDEKRLIDDVVERDHKNKQVLVRWFGLPPKFDSWMPAENARDL